MSIKYSKDISLGKMPVLFVAATVIAVALRAVQVMLYVDPTTGFSTGGEVLFVLLYAFLGVTALFALVASFLSEDAAKADFSSVQSKGLSVSAILLGVYLLLDVFQNAFSSLSSVADVFGNSTLELFRSLMLTETLPNFLGGIFAFPSAIYMFIAAKSFKKGDGKISRHRIISLSPLCWVACKFINRFVKQISFVEVSDLLLELAMLAFMLAFFYAFAQVAGGVYSDAAKWRAIALGFISSMVCLTVNLPRLVLLVTGKLNSEYPFYTIAVIFAAFAFAAATQLLRSETQPVQTESAKAPENETPENEEV